MLVKEICFACHESNGFCWSSDEDDDWDNDGIVSCHKYATFSWGHGVDIKGRPPEYCPFYLEHEVGGQGEMK